MKDSDLIERIMVFELDEQGVQLPFTSRLAREQNWTHAFSNRVSYEYKRFIVLAMLAGHPVTPSEAVDQVWHLHLVYTCSYWHDFCRDTLGTELHHGPTKGSAAEGNKFVDWYSETLLSYERLFNQRPPLDIWPSPEDRFEHAGSGRWIDSSCTLVIPLPQWLRISFWRKLLGASGKWS